MRFTSAFLLIWLAGSGLANAQLPSVDKILEQLDANSDGVLTKAEVAKSQRFARQFPRWDADGDGQVVKKDIVAFRAKFGIAADGTRPSKDEASQPATKFSIPDLSTLARVDKTTRLARNVAANSQYILKTSKHAVQGDRYFIITDHQSDEFLTPLRKLAECREGKIISVKDLGGLHKRRKPGRTCNNS